MKVESLGVNMKRQVSTVRGFNFVVCSGARRCWIGVFLLLALGLAAGCGYHLAGKATALPQNIDSLAIPIFGNRTTKHQLEQRMTAAVTDEFIARTKWRIVQKPAEAKAVLTGEVIDYNSRPVIFAGGAGSTFLVTVRMQLSLKDNTTGKFLFENRGFQFEEEFEISRESKDFFPEEGGALDRLAKEFARALVSDVLESF